MRKIFLSLGGLGFLPGSGTITSALALWVLYRFNQALPISLIVSLIIWLMIMAIIYWLSWLFIDQIVTDGDYDQSWIVTDELVGMMVAYLPILIWHSRVTGHLILTLVLFRLLDIIKPSLIGKIDKQDKPSAVLLDDVLAGAVTAVIMVGVIIIWPPLG